MEKNNFLNKPSVLSLLFMVVLFCISFSFDILFHFFKVNPSVVFLPFSWVISALIVGIIYTKINKELLSKKNKIKIAIYSLSVLLIFFLSVMTFMLGLFNTTHFHLIVRILSLIFPTLLIIISGACIYPALDLGCKIANTNKSENIDKSKLQDCLLIIFFIVLGMFFYRFNDTALNAIKPTVLKYMEHKGYIRKIKPVQIKTKHNNTNYIPKSTKKS